MFGLLGKIKNYAIILLASLIPLLYVMGIRSGKKATKYEEVVERVDTMNAAKEVRDEVKKLDRVSIDRSLNEWMRD